MADSTAPQLPNFEPGKLYLLRGATAQLLKSQIQTNRPCAVDGGGIAVVSQTKDGAVIRGANEGQGGGVTTAGDLPGDIDPNKIYFLTDKTLQAMFAAADANHTKVVTGSGLSIVADGPNGVTVASQ